jgi:hypothetical protein
MSGSRPHTLRARSACCQPLALVAVRFLAVDAFVRAAPRRATFQASSVLLARIWNARLQGALIPTSVI